MGWIQAICEVFGAMIFAMPIMFPRAEIRDVEEDILKRKNEVGHSAVVARRTLR